MFEGKKSEKDVKETVDYFSDYDTHLIHSRPLLFKKIKSFGLKIEIADGELQELIWEAYVMINGFFNITPFIKLYENARGVTWGKQMNIAIQQPQQNPEQKNITHKKHS
jgi:hypothetical protein